MRMISIIAGAAALASSLSVQAAGFTDHALIDTEIARFTGASIGTPGGARLPVDRRLKLAGCAGPLALEWYGQRRETVLVRCSDTGGWRIYVPVGGMDAAAPATRQDIAVARGETVSVTVRGQGFTLSRQGEALDQGAVGDWIRVRPLGGGSGATTGRQQAEPIRARIVRPGAVGMDLP